MQTTARFLTTVIALLAFLCVAASAAPRVALIRVNSGSATLDGKNFKMAQMANEGQSLKLPAKSEVRIQLLGSSSEVTLSGPMEVTISKTALESEAKKVTRGGVAVALDIGNRNTAGSLVTRSSNSVVPEKSRPKAIRPSLPPESRSGALFIDYDAKGDLKLAPGAEVYILIEGKSDDSELTIEQTFKETLPVLELSPDAIVKGEGYEFSLSASHNDTQLARYNQSFRILNSEQRDFLQVAESEMVNCYNQEKSVLPLLRLASLYQDLDQNKEVLKYLEIARRSPHLKANDSDLQAKLDELIEKFRKSIDMTILVVEG
jgi:hypothetical protein